jgi:uncharacterized membrane protein
MANATDIAAHAAAAPPTRIAIRRIDGTDINAALKAGWADFLAIPTQLVFLCVLYPIVGLLAGRAAFDDALMPLVWPLVAGLSLLGPICAVGLYEISRRREAGLPASAMNALDVVRSPALPQIAAMGAVLVGIFIAWLIAAHVLYRATLAPLGITGIGALLSASLGTSQGWTMLLLGNLIGGAFAAVVLCISAISIPLMLHRHVSLPAAIQVSLRVARDNPATMARWGLTVAVLLLVGALPLFIGLAVVMPLLGHATWHLYRRAVVG